MSGSPEYPVKNMREHGVVHALPQRQVHRVESPTPESDVLNAARAGKETGLVPVDGQGQHTVRKGKCLEKGKCLKKVVGKQYFDRCWYRTEINFFSAIG